ncbi:MAG: tetratricopeptide repeat protein [Elainella sp.]
MPVRYSRIIAFALSLSLSPLLLPANPATEALLPPVSAQTAQDQIAEANRLLEQGLQQFLARRCQEASQTWQQALTIYRDPEVRREAPELSRNREVMTLMSLGGTYGALSQYQQALSVFQDVGDRNGEARALRGLGLAYSSLNQYQQAIDYYQQALPIYRDVGDRKGEARALENLGDTYVLLSQYQQAIDYYQQALPILQDGSDRVTEGQLLANIGRLYAVQNSPDLAIEQLQRSVEAREAFLASLPTDIQQGLADGFADDYRFLADLLRQQGRNQEAQAVLDLL